MPNHIECADDATLEFLSFSSQKDRDSPARERVHHSADASALSLSQHALLRYTIEHRVPPTHSQSSPETCASPTISLVFLPARRDLATARPVHDLTPA